MFKQFGLAACSAITTAVWLTAAPVSAGTAAIEQITRLDASLLVNRHDLVEMVQAGAGPTLGDPPQGVATLVEQTGLGDFSLIVQSVSPGSSGLYAEVHQSAPDVQSVILQSGGMNSAVVYQTISSGSFSSIVQSGFGNTAFVSQ